MFDITVSGFSPEAPRDSLAEWGGDARPGRGLGGQSSASTSVERIDTLVAHERQIARLQAEQAELMAAHAAQVAPAGGLRGAAAEVVLARGVSPMAAEHQLHTSQVLVADLPGLLDLLHRGEISWAAASAVVRETGVTSAEVRREIDRRLAAVVERGAARRIHIFTGCTAEADPLTADFSASDPSATDDHGPSDSQLTTIAEVVRGVPQLTVLPDVRPAAATTARLAAAARRLVLLLDCGAAVKREQRVRDERRVDLVNAPDGPGDAGSALVARLPAAQAAACWHSLDHHARGRRADGDERSIGQLMADTLVERLTGVAASTGPPLPSAQVHVVIEASTLIGLDNHPAQLRGTGPITADTARTVATGPGTRWRRVIVDDAGRLVTIDRRTHRGSPVRADRSGRPDRAGHVDPTSAVQPPSDPRPVDAGVAAWLRRPIDWSIRDLDTGRRFFDGDLRTFVFARDGTCRMPVCTARITDGDHITARSDGGSTTATTARDCPGAVIICATWPGGS